MYYSSFGALAKNPVKHKVNGFFGRYAPSEGHINTQDSGHSFRMTYTVFSGIENENLYTEQQPPRIFLFIQIIKVMKKGIHAPYYYNVEVTCICGATFKINATVPGPIKVETCRFCHPAFNENKEVKKVIKGRMEKFLEKQEAIKAAQAKKAA